MNQGYPQGCVPYSLKAIYQRLILRDNYLFTDGSLPISISLLMDIFSLPYLLKGTYLKAYTYLLKVSASLLQDICIFLEDIYLFTRGHLPISVYLEDSTY